ncbi:hypothetical protein [Petroclostridium sp. X23]|uniref:hypothetical protein n=1 Tax=Petroclostridium sp. X23 TaxID=3045146 RepID=UPI0024AD4395|nr:hypothetical protein [Petroclostridium sp. X23]WHH57901.1 hypothetical protein QKW49_19110 [Petroclostridium sp. X23]
MNSPLYDTAKREWSEAVKLSKSGKRILYADGTFNNDGSISLVYNRAQKIENVGENQDIYYTNGQSDLCLMNIIPSYISIEGDLMWEDEKFYPNMLLVIQLDVTNKSELTVRSMNAEVYIGDPLLSEAILNNTVIIS